MVEIEVWIKLIKLIEGPMTWTRTKRMKETLQDLILQVQDKEVALEDSIIKFEGLTNRGKHRIFGLKSKQFPNICMNSGTGREAYRKEITRSSDVFNIILENGL